MEIIKVVVIVREVFQCVLVWVETSFIIEADIISVRLLLLNAILIIAVVNLVERLIMEFLFERCKMFQ